MRYSSRRSALIFGTLIVLLAKLRPVNLMSWIPSNEVADSHVVEKAEALVKNKRWAVMMFGSARTYAFSRSSFIENVLHQTDPPMDVFTSTQSMINSSCSIEKHSLELLEKDSTAVRFHQVNGTRQKSKRKMRDKFLNEQKKTQDRFLDEQNALLQLVEDYSNQHGITYDYIFYTRPDLHYTTQFNIHAMERAIEGNMSTIFSPRCCKFSGWCDRLGAASYQDYSKMVLSTEDWWRSGGYRYAYETAFQKRAENANLTKFDLTPKKDYGFHTLRFEHVAQTCDGKRKKKRIKGGWTDMLCNDRTVVPDLKTTPASCRLLNTSNSCPK